MKKNRMTMLLAAAAISVLCAFPSAAAAQNAAKSASQIYTEITKSVSMPGLMQMPAQYVKNYYGIDLAKYPDSFFAMSNDATSAETVVLVKTSNATDAAAVQGTLNTILKTKAEEMKNYNPEQYKIVSKSQVTVKGNNVYLIISSQESALRKLLEADL